MKVERETMSVRHILIVAATIAVIGVGTAVAQRGRSGRSGQPPDRGDVPNWEMNQEFPTDVFTFVRIEYDSYGGRGRWGGGWATDWRDADLNLSFRLQELTSLKAHPEGRVLRLTDPELLDFPFIYIVEPGALGFTDDEVLALRRYLLRGGFLMVDDFWGDYQWGNFYREIKRVFPDREPQDLTLDHDIFRCVYRLKEMPQVPSIHHGLSGMSYEPNHGPGAETPHFRAIHDDKGRMMVIICHNTDLGDGWEREGVAEEYFNEYSLKRAYPMGINILFYAMTH
jgi:hypothetical protein